MKRVLTVLFIAGYIGVLTYGNLCHVLRSGVAAHPLMYMIVWDMFCGWSAFDSRIHIVAEGESEKYYDLTHAPWGELHPYGYIGRENYDQWQNHTGPIGINVLKHTRHEPITRLFVIEECWAKKFNLPDHIWQHRYDDPKDASGKFAVVDIAPVKKLARPVTLKEIKADPSFKDFPLVRISRLSVMPVTDAEWTRIEKMSRD